MPFPHLLPLSKPVKSQFEGGVPNPWALVLTYSAVLGGERGFVASLLACYHFFSLCRALRLCVRTDHPLIPTRRRAKVKERVEALEETVSVPWLRPEEPT